MAVGVDRRKDVVVTREAVLLEVVPHVGQIRTLGAGIVLLAGVHLLVDLKLVLVAEQLAADIARRLWLEVRLTVGGKL